METRQIGSEAIADVLVTFPEKLMLQEIELKEIIDKLEDLNFVINSFDEKTYSEVEEELDSEGKKKYSNETKRKSETSRRTLLNKSYVDKKAELEKLIDKKRSLEIEYRYKRRLLRSYIALANLRRL